VTSPAGALPGAPFPAQALRRVVGLAVNEDLGGRDGSAGGDPTSSGLRGRPATAELVARALGTVAGLAAVAETARAVAGRLGTGPVTVRLLATDGQAVGPGTVLARLDGDAATLLGAERVQLNLVGRLSGVATVTAAFVAAVAGTGAVIRDTRKTTPGLRALEKYAVRCGGGANHRLGLFDALLVKDNHVAAAGGLTAAVAAARSAGPRLPLEVEVDTLDQVREALACDCELLLLDNMAPGTMRAAVELARGRARTEASGGVSLATVATVAATGVDFVAVGALTHSAPALDVALDWSA
jgi:nicotinate-nucleotide pyrophosphorylase (carboxylating)